ARATVRRHGEAGEPPSEIPENLGFDDGRVSGGVSGLPRPKPRVFVDGGLRERRIRPDGRWRADARRSRTSDAYALLHAGRIGHHWTGVHARGRPTEQLERGGDQL